MQLKTAASVATLVVTVGGAAVGLTSWVWAASSEAAVQEQRLTGTEKRIEDVDRALERHVAEARAASDRQDEALKAIGALQLEQGEDQRRILLKIAPRGTSADKPPALREAEARVRRQ